MDVLDFYGPYVLVSTDQDALGDCPLRDQHGVYVWCVPTKDFGYVVDYVGETGDSFYKRTKEHVIRTIGGDYEVCDPSSLVLGEYLIIWRGLWRKGTRDKLPAFLTRLEELAPRIREFLQVHRLFVAPTDLDERTRKRVEASIAAAVRQSKPCLLSPDVRYVARRESEQGIPFELRFPCPVYGLPGELIV